MQTHQKAFAAWAVLAAEPDVDEQRTGMGRDEILGTALKLLRYTLESHIEGTSQCEDGTSWGHTWISVLGVERMMHGVEAIEEHLTEADRRLLEKVLVSESDWLLDCYDIVGATTGVANKPESNLWNGCVLHRTAAMYPGTPRAEEYREKGSRFLANSISVASDKESAAVLDGKPVSEWYVGDNFFESYGLNHHGYMNVGYMVICLSNAAMLHFTYKKRGLTPPETLYHHVKDLWAVVKPFIFPDGRLIRIGGDTRVRYCYCQDYLIPSLILMADMDQDSDCAALEAGWLTQIEKEMEHNGDGTYLSDRCGDLKAVSPIYYTRLESDRAVTLSYGAYWRRLYPEIAARARNREGAAEPYSWSDEYHGSCFERGEKRVASWTWRAAEGPQGLNLPADGSDLAEWRYNLAGRVKGTGSYNYNEVIAHQEHSFPGGFITSGTVHACSEELLAEQQNKDVVAVQQVAFAALPDDCTVMAMQYIRTLNRSYITSLEGLLLHVPNDLFNGNQRTYCWGEEQETLQGVGSGEERRDIPSSWVNIDDRMSVVKAYGSDPLTLYRPGKRQIGIKHRHQSDTMGMLYADEICCTFYKGLKDVPPDTVVLDTGFVVQAGVDAKTTADFAAGGSCSELKADQAGPGVRAMVANGADGRRYVLVANFGEQSSSAVFALPGASSAYVLATAQAVPLQEGRLSVEIAAGEALLYVIA
jgi:hypothetical protein